jgi:hypothetical protein
MASSRTLILAAILSATVAGCVSARATMLGTGPQLAAVPPDQVRVFLQDDEVPETCERYALITLAGSSTGTSEAQMIAAARTRAGKIGANAVQLGETREPGTGRVVAGALLGINADRKGEMVAYNCAPL